MWWAGDLMSCCDLPFGFLSASCWKITNYTSAVQILFRYGALGVCGSKSLFVGVWKRPAWHWIWVTVGFIETSLSCYQAGLHLKNEIDRNVLYFKMNVMCFSVFVKWKSECNYQNVCDPQPTSGGVDIDEGFRSLQVVTPLIGLLLQNISVSLNVLKGFLVSGNCLDIFGSISVCRLESVGILSNLWNS